jgi:ATP-dependent Clp protease ATP-binding subunit ClpA
VLALARLTPAAQAVLAAAEREARDLGHSTVGGEHLLLALARHHAFDGTDVDLDLLRTELAEAAEEAHGDQAALALLGIDLNEVRRRVEELYGRGALARNGTRPRRDVHVGRSIEAARREARAAGTRQVAPRHLLLGVLASATPGTDILIDHGITAGDLRRRWSMRP